MDEMNFFSKILKDFIKYELIDDYIWYYESDLIFIDPYFVSFVDSTVVSNGQKESDILFLNDFLEIFAIKYKYYVQNRYDPNYSKLKYLFIYVEKHRFKYTSNYVSKDFHKKYYCPYFTLLWINRGYYIDSHISIQIYTNILKINDWKILDLLQIMLVNSDDFIESILKYCTELKSMIETTKDKSLKAAYILRYQGLLKWLSTQPCYFITDINEYAEKKKYTKIGVC